MAAHRTADGQISAEELERLRLTDVHFELRRLSGEGMPIYFSSGEVKLSLYARTLAYILGIWAFFHLEEINNSFFNAGAKAQFARSWWWRLLKELNLFRDTGSKAHLANGWWHWPVLFVCLAWLLLALAALLLPLRQRMQMQYQQWLSENITCSGIADRILVGWKALPEISTAGPWSAWRRKQPQPKSDRDWVRHIVRHLHQYMSQPMDPLPSFTRRYLSGSIANHYINVIYVLFLLYIYTLIFVPVVGEFVGEWFSYIYSIVLYPKLLSNILGVIYLAIPTLWILQLSLSSLMGNQYPVGMKAQALLTQLLPQLPELPADTPPPPQHPPDRRNKRWDGHGLSEDWKWPGR